MRSQRWQKVGLILLWAMETWTVKIVRTERDRKGHLTYLPDSEDFHKDVIGETGEEHLADNVNMGGERSLEL